VEFWGDRENQWIFLDPTLGLMARREGRLLSATELRRAIAERREIEWETTSHNPYDGMKGSMVEYYQNPVAFDRLFVRADSQVFAHDAFERKMRWLPRGVRQALGMLAGQTPTAVALSDHPWRMRLLSWVVTGIALLTPLLFLFTTLRVLAACWRAAYRTAAIEPEYASTVYNPVVRS